MRKLILVLLCCTVVGLAGYTGYRSYEVWKLKHLLAMAQEFHAKADERNALFSLRLALAANPQSLEAVRLTAEVLDMSRSREALLWRSRAVELNPRSTSDRLALANTAMIFNSYEVAKGALDGISADGRTNAAYENTAGALAVATGRYADAKEHFLAAIRIEPRDPTLQLNLAMVDIRGTNELAIAQARAILQQLSLNSTNAGLRHLALHELITDAMRFKHEDSALALSSELARQPDAAFPDKLIRLEVLRDTKDSDFEPMMSSLERDASSNAAELSQLVVWQQAHGTIRQGLTWLNSLSPNIRTNQPAALLIAEFYLKLKDWRGLQQCLEHQNWEATEFMRHALLARALRGQELVDSSKAEWEKALQFAGDRKMGRTMLVNLAAQWGWRNETEELLWAVVNEYPGERWADQALTEILFAAGRTHSLLELFSQELKSRPSDLVSKHNLAVTALLLDAQEYKPFDLARDVYEKAPTNSAFASTYAFSLLMQKKNAQALNIIEQMKPSDLENPIIAGYYGIILQANGNRTKAKKYLQLSAKSMHLPEEQKIFESARARG